MGSILIVDDETTSHLIMEAVLQVEGHHLTFASNGLEALEKAAALTPDLVLLDVMMPEMDGFEVCRRLRETPLLAEVPIIMVTALDDRDSRLQGIEAGADDFISKPIDFIELRARVRTIVKLNRYRRLMSERTRFERVVELAPHGILIVDATGRVRLTNTALIQLMQVSNPPGLAGHSIESFLRPAERERCAAAFARVMADPAHVECFESDWVRLDSSTFPAEIDIGHIEWDGAPALQVIVRDITRRKRAEARLGAAYQHMVELNHQMQRSRDLLRLLFDGLDSGLVLIDSNGLVQTANQAMATLLNTQPHALLACHWDEVCSGTVPFPGAWALATLADGQPRHQRLSYHDAQTRHHILDMYTLPLTGLEQAAELVILHVVDVTEQVQLEAMALANERFAANGKLAATVAHEVNTPLHTIKTSLYLAEKHDATQRARYLQLAREEIDRVNRILRQLLDLYRADGSSPAAIDCNALVDRMLVLTGSACAKNGIDVTCDLAPDLPAICGHANQVTQVLLNLILNAVDAMQSGGSLHIRTAAEVAPPAVRIEIEDTGSGIAPDVQARIFEPFFTTKPEGSGLGLAISHKIVTQHGGRLSVASTPGTGSIFTMVLPLRRSNQEQDL